MTTATKAKLELEWLMRLQRDGFVRRGVDGQLHTTQRWHGALARAARWLFADGQQLDDFRTPIARALIEWYDDEPDRSLAVAIRTMLPIAMRELARGAGSL